MKILMRISVIIQNIFDIDAENYFVGERVCRCVVCCVPNHFPGTLLHLPIHRREARGVCRNDREAGISLGCAVIH